MFYGIFFQAVECDNNLLLACDACVLWICVWSNFYLQILSKFSFQFFFHGEICEFSTSPKLHYILFPNLIHFGNFFHGCARVLFVHHNGNIFFQSIGCCRSVSTVQWNEVTLL